jgi:adenosylcobinamide-GDP ribazoletransferase
MGVDYARKVTATRAFTAIGVALAVSTVALGWYVPIAAAAVAVACLGTAALAVRKIGGIVGDALGAAQQVGETLVLVVGSSLAMHAVALPWWK